MMSLLERLVVPSRLALVYRGGETLGYNPSLNTWERLDEPSSEMLRWLRAKRDRAALEKFFVERFDYSNCTAKLKIEETAKWCILRRLLYLDQEPPPTVLVHSAAPLATVYWIC